MFTINSSGSSFSIMDGSRTLLTAPKDTFYVYLSQNTLIPVINVSNGIKSFKFNLSQTNYVGKYDAMFDIADNIFTNFDKTKWGNSEVENINGYLTVNGDDRTPDKSGLAFPIMIGNQSDFYMEKPTNGNGATGAVTGVGAVATLRGNGNDTISPKTTLKSMKDPSFKMSIIDSVVFEITEEAFAYPPPGGTITRQETAKMVAFLEENDIQEDGTQGASASNCCHINYLEEITTPTVTGTWVDGKTIYRSVIPFTSIQNDDPLVHNLNVDTYISLKVIYSYDNNPTLQYIQPDANFSGQSTNAVGVTLNQLSSDGSQIEELIYGGFGTNLSGHAIMEYTVQ